MYPYSFSSRGHKRHQRAQVQKYFFGGCWHTYRNNPYIVYANKQTAQRRSVVLAQQWATKYTSTLPNADQGTPNSLADTSDSDWLPCSDFEMEDEGEGLARDENLENILQRTKYRKNLQHREKRKEHWQAVLPSLVKALCGQSLKDDHSSGCTPQPREVLFIDCTGN